MDRVERFKAKVDGNIYKERIDRQKESMISREKDYFQDAEKVEREVKEMCDAEGSLKSVYYIIFAKEVLKLTRKHGGQTLLEEMEILQEKWRMRGLDLDYLNKIKQYYVSSYVPPPWFRLDISLLDGVDVLS